MGRTAIDEELRREVSDITENAGCELQHVEFQQGSLRVFLDHPDGVTLEHCETVSKQLSAFLDVSDFGRGRYVLEVSSPGLDRRLFSLREYRRFAGHKVRVTFYEGPERKRRTIVGKLESVEGDEDRATIRVTEEDRGDELNIPFTEIDVARLVVDI